METNPPANRNANAPQFFICDPHAPVHGVPLSHNPPVLSRADNNLFKGCNEIQDSQPGVSQVDNGVHNKLAWPVIGNVTTSFHMDYRNPGLFQKTLGHCQVVKSTPAAKRKNRGVLQEQYNIVVDDLIFSRRNEFMLKIPRFPILSNGKVHAQPFLSVQS
ncbi:hypothetical protein ES703_93927 [subsurface metagenome]